MANKKKKKRKKHQRQGSNPMKREVRLKQGALWIQEYSGKHLVRDYRKKFHLDPSQTLRDLHELGAIDDKKYEEMSRAEEKRIAILKEKKKVKEVDIWENSDDRFFFIAGYTSGGAAYGVTWEEMGLEPYEILEDFDEDNSELF